MKQDDRLGRALEVLGIVCILALGASVAGGIGVGLVALAILVGILVGLSR